ncbi:extracellular serine-rich [Pyrrhoderma noxium]|uniref:Extracellular serine-rich n=1 Tax=Pyrrhoderma noxium TaxID=2282107 RepID=A0A286UGK2_9AGAM|nr:extracellular serine-rich [Pyrrhoderma noxium]
MLYSALALALVPAFAAAQNVHNVTVGNGLTFSPINVQSVSNGDIINFVFSSPGHSVTQSSLATPCEPLDGGFNSGFSTAAGQQWNLTITDASKPIWYFCAQSTPRIHCTSGMVGAINSDDTRLASFTAAALAATDTPSITAVALSGSGAAASASLGADVAAGSATGTSATGTSSSTAAATTSSNNAALPAAGFESLGLTFLALVGAALF